MIHVIPINDINVHEHSAECPCNPRIIAHEGEVFVFHNSYDKREIMFINNFDFSIN